MSNKDAAISFLTLVAAGRVRDAYAKHIGEKFRHHNPCFAGDRQSLMTAMEDNARQSPNKRLEVLRALEDGDLVAVHSHIRQNPDDRGAVVVHIFRFDGDRIVEAWDAGQPVPEQSINEFGMF
jgi:predicted SnoaL-like aldol condensation-catalyzing enzyme